MTDMETAIAAFEVGRTYSQRFASNWDSIASFTIISRTAKSVTIEVQGKTVRRGLSTHYGAEQFKPFGSYSMAMVVSAKDTAERIAAQ